MKIDENETYKLTRDGLMGVALRMMRDCKEDLPYDVQGRFENVEMLLRQYYSYQDRAMTDRVTGAVLELFDDIEDCLAAKAALKYEYSIRRSFHVSSETLMAALAASYDTSYGITVELDAQLIVLFRQVWLSRKLDGNAIQMLRDFVLGEGREFARNIVVSALMLRCIRYYDIRIVELLMECRLAVACVAVVMIAMSRQMRIDCDAASMALFRKYMADSDNAERCAMVYDNVMRTFETQNIASEMRDKIFPVVKEQGLKFRENSEEMKLFDENGLNPEWEEKLEDSGIMDKMRRINDLQLNGADIHYESFKLMKSTPFFMDTAHWFFPFDMGYHQLEGMKGGEDDNVGDISRLINLCDSDRYSLFLMLKGMGVGGFAEALTNLGLGNYDEVREQLGGDEKWKETMKVSFATEVRFAVMNLYRFYNLAPNHSDMTSPFARVMPAEGSILGYTIVPAEIRYKAALVLFKARQWESAYGYFRSVVDEYITRDAMIYQKMGYCMEKEKSWDMAVEEYGKSDVVVPDDVWTLRHTACCLCKAGKDDMAAVIYRKVLELDRGCLDAIDGLSDICLESGEYEEAKPLLYEMEYHRGSRDDDKRLGFCLFMMGERAEALKFLDKAAEKSGASSDEFMMRAVAGGDETRIREACAMVYNAETVVRLLQIGYAGTMMKSISKEERENIKSIINKIILEQ